MTQDYNDIPFYRTPIDNRLLKNKIQQIPTLYKVFKEKINITKEVDQEMKYRMLGSMNNFATIFIVGEQGKKKSATAQSIAERHDTTKFTAERIEFDYEKYKKDLSKSQPKQWFIIDEQVFRHGIGSIRIRHDIQNIIEQLRLRGNSLIFASPQIKYFNENLFTFILEMLDDKLIVTCPKNKKPHECRTCQCYYENNFQVIHFETRSLVKRNGEYIGYYITSIQWNSPLWQEYSKLKNAHIEKVKDGKSHESPYKTLAKEIIKTPDSQKYFRNKKSIKLLINEKYPNLTTEETQLTLEAIIILIEAQNESGEEEITKEEAFKEKQLEETEQTP